LNSFWQKKPNNIDSSHNRSNRYIITVMNFYKNSNNNNNNNVKEQKELKMKE